MYLIIIVLFFISIKIIQLFTEYKAIVTNQFLFRKSIYKEYFINYGIKRGLIASYIIEIILFAFFTYLIYFVSNNKIEFAFIVIGFHISFVLLQIKKNINYIT